MQPDDQPYCGTELLPHATFPDGSPAPILCILPVHSRHVMHQSDELISWQWQDVGGNWLSGPAAEFPA